MTTYISITKQIAKKYRRNYRKATENTIGNKFGQKVKDHHSTKKSRGNKSFRTFSMSFNPALADVHGQAGLAMIITDLAISPLPPFTGNRNRYRIMPGLKDDGSRVDILALSWFKGSFDDDDDEYYEISPNANVQYDAILTSAEAWDDGSDPNGYSWHCDPHCP
ncbi:hypothetical protein GVN20_04255 [Runella sp. CRIBMP]|uniref:hypothetical protein n=1 Tax=Runella sp. CRIBMP TaxID=2683261 RepID=UPI0014127AA4|nr:hypothetical protein [Runella sp. CRIBMP]NBB18561.1 hypothetical protein [Runella sp. CRIBMP]